MLHPVNLISFRSLTRLVLIVLCALMLTNTIAQSQTVPVTTKTKAMDTVEKVILDTDIGDDIDDAYALALLLSRPNIKLLGVTTAWGQTQERAELAVKLLHVMGYDHIPVYAGRRGTAKIGRQYEWARHTETTNTSAKNAIPAVQKDDAVTFLKRAIEKSPGEITLIAVGPLVNVGDLVTMHPEVKTKLKRIVIMGGAVHSGYNGSSNIDVEWNIKCDPQAAKAVFSSGIPLTMAGLESTAMLKFDVERQKRLFARGAPTTDAIAALTILWGGSVPTLFDPMAVAWATDGKFCETEQRHVVVDDDGKTRITDGPPNVTVLINPQKDAFLDWYITSVAGPMTGSAK